MSPIQLYEMCMMCVKEGIESILFVVVNARVIVVAL